MKRLSACHWMLLLVGVMVGGAICASALELTAELAGESAYVWRGLVYNDDPVLQPFFEIEPLNHLAFGASGNFNLTDRLGSDTEFDFTEIDYTASYTIPTADGPVEIGLIGYNYPEQATAFYGERDDTHEAFIRMTGDVELSPYIAVYADFDAADAFYINGGISHVQEIVPHLNIYVTASLGFGFSDYNLYYYGVDEDGLNDGNLGFIAKYDITENWHISGNLSYMKILTDDIEISANNFYLNEDNNVYGGVTVGYSY